MVRAETGADGRFQLTGLEEELYQVRARRSGAGASEVVAVDLVSSRRRDGVRLVLWPSRKLKGRVLTNEGLGVGGAQIHIEAGGPTPISTHAHSDGDGSFRVEVPEDSRRAVFTVLAPSQLLWSGCLPTDVGEVEIRLPRHPGGTLIVQTEWSPDRPPATGGQLLAVTGDGGVLTGGVLESWQRQMNGESVHDLASGESLLTVPAVSPGTYAFLWSSAQPGEIAAAACGAAFSSQEAVLLSAGGEARVIFDLRKYQLTK